MQWNVDWKIRGKTLSKQFWIFNAVSIFFPARRARSFGLTKEKCRGAVHFCYFTRGDNTCSKTTSLHRIKRTERERSVRGRGECLIGKIYRRAMPNLLLPLVFLFCFALSFGARTKTSSALSKQPTVGTRAHIVDSRLRFSLSNKQNKQKKYSTILSRYILWIDFQTDLNKRLKKLKL